MTANLTIQAGPKALSLIRDEGLRADRITVLAGAAGGPKGLVLSGIDRMMCRDLFRDREKPLYLIGSSIGAWRFAAFGRRDQIGALERFWTAYINQRYETKPTAEELTVESFRILDAYLGNGGYQEILSHPTMRFSFMAVRSRRPVRSDKKIPLSLGLAGAVLGNLLNRHFMKLFFERTLFYDPRDKPPFWDMDEFPLKRYELTPDNLRFALIAAGSIPLLMNGVGVPGIPGVYRDGGLLDYQLDIPFLSDGKGIALYPHYTDSIIPGWLDKKLAWRKPHPEYLERVLLVSPSRDYIDRLPYRKIPDRNDFYLFKGNNDERIAYWNSVVRESERLGDEFAEAVLSGSIRDRAQHLDYSL